MQSKQRRDQVVLKPAGFRANRVAGAFAVQQRPAGRLVGQVEDGGEQLFHAARVGGHGTILNRRGSGREPAAPSKGERGSR